MATVANAADAAAWPHGAWPHGCVVPFGTPLRDTEFFRAAVGIGASTGSAPAPLDADTDDLVFRAESITAPLPHDPECLLRVFGVDVHGRTVTLKVTDTPYCVDLNVGDAEPATPDQIRDVVDCIHDKVRTAMAKAQTKVASARKKLQTARTPQQVADAEEQMKILHNITSTAIVLSHEKHVGKLSHGHQFPHLRVLDAEYQRKHTLARDADPAHRYTLRRFPDDPTDLGFRHGKSGFVRLRCQSAVMARVITECIKREDTSLHGYLKRPQRVYGHDSKIKIESRFWFSNERQLCGWLRVATGAWQRLPDGVCRDDIGAVARDCDIVGVPERSSDDAPYRIMQYDLETRCPSQQFPNPDRPEDGIDQDGITVFHSTNITKPAAKCVIVVWNGTLTSAGAVADMKDHNGNGFDLEDPVDDLTFFQVPTERDLLLLHREMVLAINPRRICGWNTSTFDDRYLGRRAERLCGKAWFDQSPWVGEHFELEKRVLESKQKGKREFETYTIPGRVNLDVMLFCKDIGSKMPSYKLENVSAALLGRHKVELGSPAKINQLMMLRHTSEVDFEFSRSPPPLDPALLDALKRRDTVKTTDELVDAMARRCGLDWMSTWIQRISHTSQPKPRIIDRPGCVSEQARRFARQLLDSIETAKQTPNARMLALVHEGLDQMCHELPKHYAARFTMTPSQAMAFIAVYCASDTLRPQEIADVRDMFGTVEELAGVGGVNMEDLLYRGQSVRTMNFIAQECYAKSHCVPFIPRPPRDFVPPGYQGAAVIDAMVGIHEDPIITLDFASLYPSIIKSHNLSWDTMVSSHTDNTEGCLCGTQWVCGCGTWNRNLVPDNPSPERQARVDAYEHGKSTHCQECGAARPPLVLATPPPQYTCPPPDDGKPYNAPRDGWEPPRSDFVRAMECLERKCPLHYCDLVDGVLDETAFCYLECHTIPRANGSWVRISFIQSPQGTPLRGIVPNAVTKLLNLRKAVKRDMEASKIAGDKAKVRKLNAKQAALKVSANSIYGFCGSETADISCPDLACTITTLGRNYLYGVCTFIAENDPAFNTGGKTVVVYGDTDSIMVRFWNHRGASRTDDATLNAIWATSEVLSQKCNDTIKHHMSLEVEKIMMPMLLVSRKRYASTHYVKMSDGSWDKYPDAKGLDVVRSGTDEYSRAVSQGIIDKCLALDRQGALDVARRGIDDLLSGRVSIYKLLRSKLLSKPIDSYASPPEHVRAAAKMRDRDPSNAPTVGDRVDYVYVRNGGKGGHRAENVVHAMISGLPVDYFYYFSNGIRERVCDYLGLIYPDPESMFKDLVLRYQPEIELLEREERARSAAAAAAARGFKTMGDFVKTSANTSARIDAEAAARNRDARYKPQSKRYLESAKQARAEAKDTAGKRSVDLFKRIAVKK